MAAPWRLCPIIVDDHMDISRTGNYRHINLCFVWLPKDVTTSCNFHRAYVFLITLDYWVPYHIQQKKVYIPWEEMWQSHDRSTSHDVI